MWGLFDKYILQPIIARLKRLFIYPIRIGPISQAESKKGYIFIVEIASNSKDVVIIPHSQFSLKLIIDKKLKVAASKDKILYGETVSIFDSEAILNAYLTDTSYGNVSNSIDCGTSPKKIYLLLRVAGPGSNNPSSRLLMAKIYKGVKISIKKRYWTYTYIEIPLPQIGMISGNDKTRIIDS